MTNREKQILELIKENPTISQNELAERLGIKRSSVAVHIANLIKKGFILGKGYIVKDENYVSIIGGVNVDIQGFSKQRFVLRDSNPGNVKISMGGVGRNIGENLVKIGINTKLISVLGNDIYGRKILEESRQCKLDLTHCLVLNDESTSTYLCILDEKGDMISAIASMDIFDKMSLDFIKSKLPLIRNSSLCIIDTNIPKEIIEYVTTNESNTDFFLDTVSTSKARKVRDIIGKFHTIKPNKIEAEVLCGFKIRSNKDLTKAGQYFLDKGVKRVFISLGKDGVYYNDSKHENKISAPSINVINATGAGDAFMAGLAYCYINGYDIDYTVKFSMGASILALQSERTINPNMSIENILSTMKEAKLC